MTTPVRELSWPSERMTMKSGMAMASGASLLVHDATYLSSEYESHKGWGHSTPEEAVDLPQGVVASHAGHGVIPRWFAVSSANCGREPPAFKHGEERPPPVDVIDGLGL